MNERDFAISPDGKEVYYTISTPQSTFQTIVVMTRTAAGWTKPEVASFAGEYSDLEPTFSADGKQMFFASNRPLKTPGDPKDFDIWVVDRKGSGWGAPRNLGAPINTSADEFYPSVGKTGNLYFTAEYEGGIGKEDIYISKWANGRYEKPVALDTAVNGKTYEFNAFVDPDERFIIYTSFGRKDDTGRGDLYISHKDGSGKWLPAKNLKFANSARLDYCPYVSPDKKMFFFTSERSALPRTFEAATYEKVNKVFLSPLNGTGNIYWVSFDRLSEYLK